MTTQEIPAPRTVERWLSGRRAQYRLAFLLAIAQGSITVTGSIVRVTGSGLGCNTWPNCHEGSLVPVQGAAPWIQQLIEFGNRLLTFVLVAIAIALLVGVVKAGRRKEIVIHALVQNLGIVLQAVIGGISVHMDLRWWAVALHFLPSMILVWLAVILWVRIREEDDLSPTLVVARRLRWWAVCCAVLLCGVLITGTMVTGAGVHAGDSDKGMEGRLDVDLSLMAHIHAWVMYTFLAMTVLLVVGLVRTHAPLRMQHVGWMLVGTILLQAMVGIAQFRLGVPRWTVPIHIALSSCVVGTCAGLWALGLRRQEAPDAAPAAR